LDSSTCAALDLPFAYFLRIFAYIFPSSLLLLTNYRDSQRRTFTSLDDRFHKIGDSAENDSKLYVAEEPTWHIGAEVTDDGR